MHMSFMSVLLRRQLPHATLKPLTKMAPNLQWSIDSRLLQNQPSQIVPSLPCLPVPTLNDTLTKYLRTVKPLLSESEFLITQDVVNKFGTPGGVGDKLQQMLEEKASKSENWLADWWLNTAYLQYRWPVVVWSSPGLVFPIQKFHAVDEQVNYAAKLIAGALEYKVLIDEKKIPLQFMGKEPLDMAQFFKLLGTCRIPGITCDSLRYCCSEPSPPEHIVVAHNDHFFKINVYGKSGLPLNIQQLAEQLRLVMDRSTQPATASVGILTSQNRNIWGKLYKQLRKDATNARSLEEIQRSLFVVSLDGPVVTTASNELTTAALQCLHGNGSRGYAGNRWYDKTVQFIVGRTGVVGLTYEHSPAEGGPVTHMMDFILDHIKKSESTHLNANEATPPEHLTFSVTGDTVEEIEKAKSDVDSLVNDLEMTCFKYDTFGKDFLKGQKLSPDSFIQMAIQLAFYRVHGEPGATYESASTRKYLHGRTETIRSCGLESVEFVRIMEEASASVGQKVEALRAAVEAHGKYARDAVNGFGVDRHLLGLKLSAIEAGLDVPSLYMDVGYIRSSHMRLSTSQVPAHHEAFMCFGPLVPDGYGCCYNPRSDSIMFGTSALRSSPDTSSEAFCDALKKSLTDMHDVLLLGKTKSKL